MPIRPELKPLYPRNWKAISASVRFGRARGRCETCARPHGQGRPARDPDLFDLTVQRTTKVVLAAAHRDHDPRRNGQRNLRTLC